MAVGLSALWCSWLQGSVQLEYAFHPLPEESKYNLENSIGKSSLSLSAGRPVGSTISSCLCWPSKRRCTACLPAACPVVPISYCHFLGTIVYIVFLCGLCLFPDAWGCMWWQATAVVCARLQESSAAPHARCGHPGHLTYRSSTVSIGRAYTQVTHLSPPLTQLGKLTQAKRPSPGPCVLQPGWKLSSCLAHQPTIHYSLRYFYSCLLLSSSIYYYYYYYFCPSFWLLLMSVVGQVACPSFFPILLDWLCGKVAVVAKLAQTQTTSRLFVMLKLGCLELLL